MFLVPIQSFNHHKYLTRETAQLTQY